MTIGPKIAKNRWPKSYLPNMETRGQRFKRYYSFFWSYVFLYFGPTVIFPVLWFSIYLVLGIWSTGPAHFHIIEVHPIFIQCFLVIVYHVSAKLTNFSKKLMLAVTQNLIIPYTNKYFRFRRREWKWRVSRLGSRCTKFRNSLDGKFSNFSHNLDC